MKEEVVYRAKSLDCMCVRVWTSLQWGGTAIDLSSHAILRADVGSPSFVRGVRHGRHTVVVCIVSPQVLFMDAKFDEVILLHVVARQFSTLLFPPPCPRLARVR